MHGYFALPLTAYQLAVNNIFLPKHKCYILVSKSRAKFVSSTWLIFTEPRDRMLKQRTRHVIDLTDG
jgi:hypothetical protein